MKEYTKAEILEAMKDSFGVISNIADKLGCAWHTAEKYINKWQETKVAYQDQCERSLDFSESKMFTRIKEDSDSMIKFHLVMKGKKRDYGDKLEISGDQDKPLVTLVINDTIKEPSNGKGGNGKE